MSKRKDTRGPVENLLEVLARIADTHPQGHITATNAELCALLGTRAGENGTSTQIARAIRSARAEGRIRVSWLEPGQRRRDGQPARSGRVIEIA